MAFDVRVRDYRFRGGAVFVAEDAVEKRRNLLGHLDDLQIDRHGDPEQTGGESPNGSKAHKDRHRRDGKDGLYFFMH